MTAAPEIKSRGKTNYYFLTYTYSLSNPKGRGMCGRFPQGILKRVKVFLGLQKWRVRVRDRVSGLENSTARLI